MPSFFFRCRRILKCACLMGSTIAVLSLEEIKLSCYDKHTSLLTITHIRVTQIRFLNSKPVVSVPS